MAEATRWRRFGVFPNYVPDPAFVWSKERAHLVGRNMTSGNYLNVVVKYDTQSAYETQKILPCAQGRIIYVEL
jgi:hypothetical protein